MRCIICESNQWENVDHARLTKKGMAICTSCGFVSYPEKAKKDLKGFYNHEYRQPPTINNAYTSQRKIHYHTAFLAELFAKWEHEKVKPVIGEIGAAYGAFLNYLKGKFPEAKISGTEWTQSYKRVAYHEFGIDLKDELDLVNTKYDMLVSYKVAEHQLDADKEIIKLKEALKENGYLYISVPTWFDVMEDHGREGLDLEFYYDPAHVNVWTREAFEFLLKKCGLQVVKENQTFYNSTYLCKRNDKYMETPQFKNDPEDIKNRLTKIKAAYVAFKEGDFDKAISIWPRYPEAYAKRYEMTRAKVHSGQFEDIKAYAVKPFLDACPDLVQSYGFAADLCTRYEQYEEAVEHLEKCLELRPNNPPSLMALSQVFRQMAIRSKGDQRIHFFKEARTASRHLSKVSRQHEPDCVSWIYSDDAEIPTPSELKANEL